MTAMTGMEMPDAPTASMGFTHVSMGFTHVLICPIVLALIFVLTLVAGATIAFIARDPRHKATRRLALRGIASLPIVPFASVLAGVSMVCIGAMVEVDGLTFPPLVICAGFVVGIVAISLMSTMTISVMARSVVALGVRLVITLIALCTRLCCNGARSFRAFRVTFDFLATAMLLGSCAGLRAPPAVVR